MRRPALLLALLLAGAGLPGCLAGVAVAGAGAYGAVKYAQNASSRTYKTTVAAAFHAAEAALQEGGYPPPGTSMLGTSEGTLKAGDAWIRVEAWPDDTVRVLVRVGTFDKQDNRRRASLLIEAISAKLVGAPPGP